MSRNEENMPVEATIRRVLVANRGEIAIRVFDTAREMGITCVAVYSDADRDGRHVRAADLAVHLPGSASADTYLNIPAILAAAKRTEADAIHPGYGFLAENPEFAEAVIGAGLTWIGPPPEAIRAMALKVEAKNAAAAAGVPLVPGAELDTELTDLQIAERAEQVGYPVMIKASAGGGGKGMRVVSQSDELLAAVEGARRESQSAFGDPTVFLERYLPRARHVEVQVFGDQHGNYLHLFDRECSIQRRHQKIIEEAPSPGTTDATRERMYTAALSLAARIGYVGAGTVEFLVSGDGDAQEFFFLEMNTRLQVEHRVTEEITGTDLVQWQILVAQGKEFTVEQDDLDIDGHAIEVRLYAEDPAQGFLPSVGKIGLFASPSALGAVVDASYASGDTVPQFYDPLLAKITTSGPDRQTTTQEMLQALSETTVTGITTNRDMLMAILGSFPFFAGDTTTAFLEEHPGLLAGNLLPEGQNPPPALVVAAAFHFLDTIDSSDHWITDVFAGNLTTDPVPPRFRNVSGTPGFLGLQYGSGESARRVWVLYESARANRWRVWLNPGEEPFAAEREFIGEVRVTRPAPDEDSLPDQFLLVEIDGLTSRVETDTDEAGVRVAGVDGRFQFRPVSVGERSEAGSGDQGPVSPLPGTVAAIEVQPGQQVSEGETLVVLEAMKMEHRITADGDGTIDQVLVTPGQSVEAHQVLVTFAAGGDDD
jgi:acetyl/propionyl-CoA carboxylase alpha subunit